MYENLKQINDNFNWMLVNEDKMIAERDKQIPNPSQEVKALIAAANKRKQDYKKECIRRISAYMDPSGWMK